MKKERRFQRWKIFLLSAIIGLFAYEVSNIIFICNQNAIFGEYSKEDYKYLLGIVKKTIIEGKGIHTEGIPKDVYYLIEQPGNADMEDITCEYGLKSNVECKITIILSGKDKEILSKDSIYETEERYKRVRNEKIDILSIIIGALIFGIIFI